MKIDSKEKSWILRNASKKELQSAKNFLKEPKKRKSKGGIRSFYSKKTKRDDLQGLCRSEVISTFRMDLLSKATKSEKEAYELLDLVGIDYIKQHPIVTDNNFFFADLFIPSANLIVEIDGAYHKDKSVQDRDKWRSGVIRSLGYRIIRYDNSNIFDRVKFLSDLSKRGGLDIPARMYI